MKRFALAALPAALVAMAAPAAAQETRDFSQVEIKVTDLGPRTYMLEGRGGNIVVAVGDDGVIMVDGQFAPLHDKIEAAVAKLSDKPVKYLINTHFHSDHTGGNAAFAKDGAAIVAHENVKARLAEGTTHGLTGAKTPPASPGALPTRTYRSTLELKVAGRTAQLRHVARAHTDGDTYVLLKDVNVLATGDIVVFGRYPNIDFANGGTVRGMVGGIGVFLKTADEATKIVPGHGPVAGKTRLAEYRTMLITAHNRVVRLMRDGKSEAEIVAAKPFADLDAGVGATERQSANFVRVLYNMIEHSRKKN